MTTVTDNATGHEVFPRSAPYQVSPLWQQSCWFSHLLSPDRTIPMELEERDWEFPHGNMSQTHCCYPRFNSFFLNKCFLIYVMPVVDFQEFEMVVFHNCVQLHRFWGR